MCKEEIIKFLKRAEGPGGDRDIVKELGSRCVTCGGTGKLMKFWACRGVASCSKEHQKEDWKAHKIDCKVMAAAMADGLA